MMAVSDPADMDYDAPAQPAQVHAGRSAFKVPEQVTVLHARCPVCGGNSYAEHGEIRCMLCCRELYIAVITDTGRVLKLTLLHVAPVLSRAGYGERQRAAKAKAREEGGLTGLASRVLRNIPESPGYAVVETLSKAVSAHREDVREALDALQDEGLVECFQFKGGYRQGWRRPGADA